MAVRTILIALIAAGLAATTAGAGVSSSPKDLLLKQSDMPAGAKRYGFKTASGSVKIPRIVRGKAAVVGYRFKNGSATEVVYQLAGIVGSSKDAHDVYVSQVRKTKESTYTRVSVPKYAQEQTAFGVATKVYSAGFIIARKGNVVWELVVFAFPGLSKHRTVAQLSKYGAKAKARVG
jgi:hypothetical protein